MDMHLRAVRKDAVVAVHQAEERHEHRNERKDAGAAEAAVREVAKDGRHDHRAHDAAAGCHIGDALHAAEGTRTDACGVVEVVEVDHIGDDEHDADEQARVMADGNLLHGTLNDHEADGDEDADGDWVDDVEEEAGEAENMKMK